MKIIKRFVLIIFSLSWWEDRKHVLCFVDLATVDLLREWSCLVFSLQPGHQSCTVISVKEEFVYVLLVL